MTHAATALKNAWSVAAMRADCDGATSPGRSATRNFSRRVASIRLAATIQESSQERPVGISTPS